MSTAERIKGGQKAWTNEEQKQWLTDRLPAYLASRGGKSASDFWPDIFEGWFQEWPLGHPSVQDMESGLAEGERLKLKKNVTDNHSITGGTAHQSNIQQQIKDWFKNRSRVGTGI